MYPTDLLSVISSLSKENHWRRDIWRSTYSHTPVLFKFIEIKGIRMTYIVLVAKSHNKKSEWHLWHFKKRFWKTCLVILERVLRFRIPVEVFHLTSDLKNRVSPNLFLITITSCRHFSNFFLFREDHKLPTYWKIQTSLECLLCAELFFWDKSIGSFLWLKIELLKGHYVVMRWLEVLY